MQSAIGKGQEHQHRLTRLADGREAVRLGTEAQKRHIIQRFEEETRKTPQRKKLYQEAINKALDDGVELETSSLDIKPSSFKDVDANADRHREGPSVEALSYQVTEDDDVVFAREIELAMKLSLETNEQNKH